MRGQSTMVYKSNVHIAKFIFLFRKWQVVLYILLTQKGKKKEKKQTLMAQLNVGAVLGLMFQEEKCAFLTAE